MYIYTCMYMHTQARSETLGWGGGGGGRIFFWFKTKVRTKKKRSSPPIPAGGRLSKTRFTKGPPLVIYLGIHD